MVSHKIMPYKKCIAQMFLQVFLLDTRVKIMTFLKRHDLHFRLCVNRYGTPASQSDINTTGWEKNLIVLK